MSALGADNGVGSLSGGKVPLPGSAATMLRHQRGRAPSGLPQKQMMAWAACRQYGGHWLRLSERSDMSDKSDMSNKMVLVWREMLFGRAKALERAKVPWCGEQRGLVSAFGEDYGVIAPPQSQPNTSKQPPRSSTTADVS